MALRNQPYFPLYVRDVLSDERLKRCKPASAGVYLFLMCNLHMEKEYGTILLKQKDKQNESNIINFACILQRLLPYTYDEILPALEELVDEEVLLIDGDKLIQKRMVKDNYISEVRSSAGSKGGRSKQNNEFASTFAKAKPEAKIKQNPEYEYEYEDEIESENSSNNLSDENFSKNQQTKKTDPWNNPHKPLFDEVCIQVFGSKPSLINEDFLNFALLVDENPDFVEKLPVLMSKVKHIYFEDIQRKADARWFLKPKNYADLRNGVYDKQVENSEKDSEKGVKNGFTY